MFLNDDTICITLFSLSGSCGSGKSFLARRFTEGHFDVYNYQIDFFGMRIEWIALVNDYVMLSIFHRYVLQNNFLQGSMLFCLNSNHSRCGHLGDEDATNVLYEGRCSNGSI